MKLYSGSRNMRLSFILLSALFSNSAISNDQSNNLPTYRLEIPEQNLSISLRQLSLDTGVVFKSHSEGLEKVRAPSLSGNMTVEQAVKQLLAATNLVYVIRQDGSFLIQDSAKEETPETLVVMGNSRNLYEGVDALSSQDLMMTPTGNGNLTDMLERLPAIESQGASGGSHGAGELTPENISINGARFSQNKFVIDGITVNNDLDPGFSDPNDFNRLGSHSQGLYVDVDSIESVEVYDHNISASKGQFTGGSVEVKTKRYNGNNLFGLKWRHTSDSLTSYHFDDSDSDAFAEGELGFFQASSSVQPKFDKNFYTGYAAVGLGGDWGSYITFSRKKSTIPFMNANAVAYNVGSDGSIEPVGYVNTANINQYRINENISIKTSWTPSESESLDIKFLYGTGESRYQLGAVPGSDFTTKHHSTSFGLGYQNTTEYGQYRIDIDTTRMGDKRDSDNKYTAIISGLHPSRNEMAGGPPVLDNKQNSMSFKSSFLFDEMSVLRAKHKVNVGLELSRKKMESRRPEETLTHTFICYSGSCTKDTLTYFSKAYNYSYHLDVTQNEYAIWLEDNITFGRLNIRPGVRADYNNFLRNTDIAPRLAVSWDLFGDAETHLISGYNRYYGRSFLELEAKKTREMSLLSVLYPDKPWKIEIKPNVKWQSLNSLRTPYDDEIVLGLNHLIGNFKVGLTGINRQGKDQISSEDKPAEDATYYTNNSLSETNTVTARIETLEYLTLGSTLWGIDGSLKWMERKSNQLNEFYGKNSVYDGTVGSPYGIDRKDKVIYEGEVIDIEDLPVNGLGTPLKAQLSINTLLPEYDVSISNYMTWRDDYTSIQKQDPSVDSATGERLLSYKKVDYEQSFTWDMQMRWSPTFNDVELDLALDILNVLDDKNIASSENSTLQYDVGRQYWLELGVNF